MINLNDGNKIPKILFGTYLITDEKVLEECLDTAINAGYRGIDTATVYRNEEIIGKWLKKLSSSDLGLNRKDLFITSKLSPKDQGYKKALEAVKRSLDLLDSDGYIDLYLVHWPGTSGIERGSEAEVQRENRIGSWRALLELKRAGVLRSVGVSNYTERHLKELANVFSQCDWPAVNQMECHPHLTQKPLIKLCNDMGIHFQAYSSLGSTSNHDKLMKDPKIIEVAESTEGKSVSQVLLRWAVQKGISILPKSTNLAHIISNFDVLNWELTENQMSQLDDLDKNEHFCWDPNTVV